MFYLRAEQLPELSHLPRRYRRAAWVNFICSRPPAETRRETLRLSCTLVAGMLAGSVLGPIAFPIPTVGPLIGVATGLLAPLLVFQFVRLHRCRPALQAYVAMPKFTVMPISERAARSLKTPWPPQRASAA